MVRSEHFLGQYGQLFRLFDVISSMSGVESDFFAIVDRLVDRLGVSDNVWPFGVLDCDPFELLFGPVIDFIATLRFFDSGGDRESSCSDICMGSSLFGVFGLFSSFNFKLSSFISPSVPSISILSDVFISPSMSFPIFPIFNSPSPKSPSFTTFAPPFPFTNLIFFGLLKIWVNLPAKISSAK